MVKNQWLCSFLLLSCCALSNAQTPVASGLPSTNQANSPSWTEHYRKATISFGIIQKQPSGPPMFTVIGTGVIVASDSRHAYIATAKHVFFNPDQGWHPTSLQVRFSSQEGKTFTEELGLPIQLTNPVGLNLWTSPADGADIAVIPVQPQLMRLVTNAVGFQDFATNEDVYDGASVFVFGYPADTKALIGPNGLVRAVTRSGIIAWTDPRGALNNPLLLDSNILPGNSGGPAFKVPSGLNREGTFVVGGRVAFLGIVTADLSGYYNVQADGRIIQTQFPDLPKPSVEQVQVIGIGGLGKVEPAIKVKELIEKLAASH